MSAITRDHGDSSDHHAIHPKNAFLRLERRNRLRLNQRRVLPPEVFELAFVACAIEVQQVGLVGGRVIGEPLVHVRDADLVKQRQPVPRSLAFISQHLGNKRLIHRRLILPAQIKRALIHVPLHRMAKQMSQQEQALLRRDGVVHVNLRAVQVAGERVRDVARDDGNAVVALQMLMHARSVIDKRDGHKRDCTRTRFLILRPSMHQPSGGCFHNSFGHFFRRNNFTVIADKNQPIRPKHLRCSIERAAYRHRLTLKLACQRLSRGGNENLNLIWSNRGVTQGFLLQKNVEPVAASFKPAAYLHPFARKIFPISPLGCAIIVSILMIKRPAFLSTSCFLFDEIHLSAPMTIACKTRLSLIGVPSALPVADFRAFCWKSCVIKVALLGSSWSVHGSDNISGLSSRAKAAGARRLRTSRGIPTLPSTSMPMQGVLTNILPLVFEGHGESSGRSAALRDSLRRKEGFFPALFGTTPQPLLCVRAGPKHSSRALIGVLAWMRCRDATLT